MMASGGETGAHGGFAASANRDDYGTQSWWVLVNLGAFGSMRRDRLN